MYRYRIGIDNGTTGRVTVLDENGALIDYFQKPLRTHRLHTKEYATRQRIDVQRYKDKLRSYADGRVLFERPFAGTRVKAVVSGETCLEAEMIALEQLGIPYSFCASTDWQPRFLGVSSEDTKVVSLRKGRERWGYVDFEDDADSAFIALLLHELGHETIDSWRKEKKKKPKPKKKHNENTDKSRANSVRSDGAEVSRRRTKRKR